MNSAWPTAQGKVFRKRFSLPLLMCGLILGTWVGLSPCARADHLDQELAKEGPKIMKDLRTHGYKNIGVLKFRVQKGNEKPTFNDGLFNISLAARLENALILTNDEKSPIGIVYNASQAAFARDPNATYLTTEGRESLFQPLYPLAWGKDRVAVDAFLTGLVQISPDLKTTTVHIEAFDRQSQDLRPVLRFLVRTDRAMLSDMGESFFITRVSLRRPGVSDAQLDDAAVVNAAFRPDQGTANKVEGAPAPGSVRDLIDLQVFYEDQLVPIRPDPQVPGELRIDEPKENQKVYFKLTNKSGERLAVELRVNGINTLGEEENLEVGQYTKWLLEPTQTTRIQGFYSEDRQSVKLFKVLSDAESGDFPLARENSRWWIEMDVFGEGPGEPDTAPRHPLSLRGLSAKEYRHDHPETLALAKSAIRKKARTPAVEKSLIVRGQDAPAGPVVSGGFKNPIHLGTLRICYSPRGRVAALGKRH